MSTSPVAAMVRAPEAIVRFFLFVYLILKVKDWYFGLWGFLEIMKEDVDAFTLCTLC